MAEATPIDLLRAAVWELLEPGRVPLSTILARLDGRGLLDHLREEGVPEDELGAAVADDVVVTDAIWVTTDDVFVRSASLTDGMVLTHRLTAEDVEQGSVPVIPDLVVLDWDARDGVELATGGWVRHASGASHEPGEDFSVLLGPEGWLDSFGAGDLVAFTRTGATVALTAVAGPVGDEREVALLGAAAAGRIPPGGGEEALPVVLDAMAADTGAFRRPLRPLGELLEAAGLERRGFSFGPAGEPWRSAGQLHRERRFENAAATWGLDPCCMKELVRVVDGFGAFAGRAGGGVDMAAMAKALAHGAVADAFAEMVLPGGGRGSTDVAGFAEAVVAGTTARRGVPARLLSAIEADRRGDVRAAESMLADALRADPGYGPAALRLADYAVDRGDLDRALALLRHPELPADGSELPLLEGFRAELAALYRGVGRNDRCPCGSGRKFKQCCLAERPSPLSARVGLVLYKLARFAARERMSDGLGRLAAAARDPAADQAASRAAPFDTAFLMDVAMFEGGGGNEYLYHRGELLPSDERELIAAMLDEPRRLWEVVGVEPGVRLELRDTSTGDVLPVAEHLGSMDRRAGELLLTRVARLDDQNQLVGIALEIPLRLRESAMALVDSGPGATDLARWFGEAMAPPRLVNRESEPLLLCRTELATGHDLPALHAALDGILEADGDEWVELGPPDGDGHLVRGRVRHEAGRLVIETNSVERRNRLVTLVEVAVGNTEVMADERVDPRQAMAAAEPRDDPPDDPPEEVPDEVVALLDEYVRRMESEWVDMAVPALGGFTPRQARDDPTRREDLEALLREMERQVIRGPGRGFDARRLRDLLGM